MKNFVNISASEEKPRFIDLSSVTAIHVQPEKGELTIFNEKGVLLYLNAKASSIDTDLLLQKLSDAGNPLVALPARYDDKEYPHFVSPKAVTFATVTEVTKDGTQGVIVGVKGLGWEENNKTKPEELAALLDAVRATGATLLEFKPEEAHARWYNAAALYINPAAVREIRDDGTQVNVYFAASGSLDVQTNDHTYQRDRVSEILNDLLGDKDPAASDLRAIGREAQRLAKEEETAARVNFAAKLAAAAGTLTQVQTNGRAVYVKPEEFVSVSFYNDDRAETGAAFKFSMSLERQKSADNPYPEAVRVFFNSAAEREKSFQALVSPPAPVKKNGSALKP